MGAAKQRPGGMVRAGEVAKDREWLNPLYLAPPPSVCGRVHRHPVMEWKIC